MTASIERRLQERLLLDGRPEGDRLMLDDATLAAALDGSRPLTAGERAALTASPLTARRLRTLALARRRTPWHGSKGLLRAASTAHAHEPIATDDGWWLLHLVPEGAGWRTVLQLAPHAPFAPALLAGPTRVRVRAGSDPGAGTIILLGMLDGDGECEDTWPFADAPHAWLQAHGAAFSVERA